MTNITNQIVRGLLRGYTRFVSPHKGYECAHRIVLGGESCSSFYNNALGNHKVLEATRLLHKRLQDCQSVAKTTPHKDGKIIVPCIPFI